MVILAADFRQTHLESHSGLNMQVHVHGELSAEEFADKLLQLGNGAMNPIN